MVTIPIQAQLSTEQLLDAVAQLPPDELASFIARAIELQSRGTQERAEADTTQRLDQEVAAIAEQVRATGQRVLGLNKGAILVSDDFDAPLPEAFWLGTM
jgi:hypothetical protein